MPSRDDELIDNDNDAHAPATASAKRRTPAREGRVVGQPGFVLHSYPY